MRLTSNYPSPAIAVAPKVHGFAASGHGGTWRAWAPRASQIELLIKDGNAPRTVPLKHESHGWFSGHLADVPDGTRYVFRINGEREYPDPASRWQPDGVHQPSAVYRPSQFTWTDQDWTGLSLHELVIYELHAGTFTREGTFDAIVPRLQQLRDCGVNCLEIMPVAQFPGRRGWGYDGVHPFAVQQSYGGPRGLQNLVNECHVHGMAVLLDVVYNHLGPEGNYLNQFGPYFTDRHHTPWGAAWNYDDRGCDEVRQFVLENVAYWLEDFHFDGLRLDAVHTIIDNSPTHILREIQRVADEVAERVDRPLHIIAESNLNDVRLLDSSMLGGFGLAAQWSDDFHHSVHALLTGEQQRYYADYGKPEQLVKALQQTFVYDGIYSSFYGRRYGAGTKQHPGSHFVVSIQTHDQVGNRPEGDRLGTLLSPGQQRLAAGLLLLSPHIPMLFMGEEYGEIHPFPYFCDFQDDGLIAAVRKGRCEEFSWSNAAERIPDPQAEVTFESAILSWDWENDSDRAGLRRWYTDLLAARRSHSALQNFVHRVAAWHPRKNVDLNGEQPKAGSDQSTGILELLRRSEDTAALSLLLVYFNFGSDPQVIQHGSVQGYLNWRLLLSSEWPQYGGQRAVNPQQSEFTPNNSWQILPWEVAVFSHGD